jgi:hypothetical protein
MKALLSIAIVIMLAASFLAAPVEAKKRTWAQIVFYVK